MSRTFRRLIDRTLRLRRPPVMAAIGIGSTLVLALVVVIVLLLTGGGKAVPDNAALIAALIALGGVFTTQLVNIALEAQRAQDSALQAFLDQLSHSDTRSDTHSDTYTELRKAPASGHKRAIQRAKLQTLLIQLDGKRKGVLLSFLHGAKLIRKRAITPYEYTKEGSEVEEERWKYPILRLNDIDLSQTELDPGTKLTFDDLQSIILCGAKLSGVNLSGANLRDADLRDADLSGAALRRPIEEDAPEVIPGEKHDEVNKAMKPGRVAPNGLLETDLSGAKLSGTNLSEADLSGAILVGTKGITNEELEKQAKSLKGTIMPDGSKHP